MATDFCDAVDIIYPSTYAAEAYCEGGCKCEDAEETHRGSAIQVRERGTFGEEGSANSLCNEEFHRV
jgi:hypothetical protein